MHHFRFRPASLARPSLCSRETGAEQSGAALPISSHAAEGHCKHDQVTPKGSAAAGDEEAAAAAAPPLWKIAWFAPSGASASSSPAAPKAGPQLAASAKAFICSAACPAQAKALWPGKPVPAAALPAPFGRSRRPRGGTGDIKKLSAGGGRCQRRGAKGNFRGSQGAIRRLEGLQTAVALQEAPSQQKPPGSSC